MSTGSFYYETMSAPQADSITKSDSVVFGNPYRALFIGTTGHVSIVEGTERIGSGKITVNGTAVTGIGTSFNTDIYNQYGQKIKLGAGDIIIINTVEYIVASVASDTSLTLVSGPASPISEPINYTYFKQNLFKNLPSGSTLSVKIKMIRSTNTTASDLIGLY